MLQGNTLIQFLLTIIRSCLIISWIKTRMSLVSTVQTLAYNIEEPGNPGSLKGLEWDKQNLEESWSQEAFLSLYILSPWLLYDCENAMTETMEHFPNSAYTRMVKTPLDIHLSPHTTNRVFYGIRLAIRLPQDTSNSASGPHWYCHT